MSKVQVSTPGAKPLKLASFEAELNVQEHKVRGLDAESNQGLARRALSERQISLLFVALFH
ncbi:MAG: hypothetical protein L3J19_08510 [Sulfurimonas sp.]|nr:hypothetical protein [Sulfurimonas sp.]